MRSRIFTAPALPSRAAGDAPPGSMIWFQPGRDRTNIWSFDPVSATGCRREFTPARRGWPVRVQHSFRYTVSGPTVRLAWLAPGRPDLIDIIGYSTDSDVMLVSMDGHREYWLGSAYM